MCRPTAVEPEGPAPTRGLHPAHRLLVAAALLIVGSGFVPRAAGAQSCIGTTTLDFNDNTMSPLLTTAADPACASGSVTVSGGALVISRPAGIGTNCANAASLASAYQICGDFDVQVDFDLVDFPVPASGRTRYATFYVYNQVGGGYLGVERQLTSSPGGCRPFANFYKVFFNTTADCGSTQISTTTTQGKIRITRSGTTWNAYVWEGGVWVLARTNVGGTGSVGFSMYTGGDALEAQTVHFDNILVNSAPCITDLTDDFEDGVLAPHWTDVSSAGCGTVTESGGALRLSKPDGCVGFAIARLAPSSFLCGDFDFTIAYTLNMPAAASSGGSIHGLQLRTASSGALVAGAERYRQGSTSCVAPQFDSYKFYTTISGCPPDAIYLPTPDARGWFRVTRQGSTVRAYYLDMSTFQWVLGLSRSITTEPLYVQLNSGTNGSLSAATSGTFDDVNLPPVRLCEAFDGLSTDSPAHWVASANACGTPAEVDGEIALTQAAGCTDGFLAVTLDPAQHVIRGDFDITVDFRLPDYSVPSPGDRVAGLRLLDMQGGYYATIERYNRLLGACNPGEQNYKAWFTNSLNCSPEVQWAATTDAQGRFRISRSGSAVTAYYWNGGWIGLNGTTVPTQADVQLQLFAAIPNGSSGHDVRFDNLCINANLVTAVEPTGAKNGTAIRLTPAVPNPFRDATRIDLLLPSSGRVQVDVFDVSGRKVDTLLDAECDAGERSIFWRPTSQRSGLYFVRARSSNGSTARTVLLAR